MLYPITAVAKPGGSVLGSNSFKGFGSGLPQGFGVNLHVATMPKQATTVRKS